jgi:hypothetical protein
MQFAFFYDAREVIEMRRDDHAIYMDIQAAAISSPRTVGYFCQHLHGEECLDAHVKANVELGPDGDIRLMSWELAGREHCRIPHAFEAHEHDIASGTQRSLEKEGASAQSARDRVVALYENTWRLLRGERMNIDKTRNECVQHPADMAIRLEKGRKGSRVP